MPYDDLLAGINAGMIEEQDKATRLFDGARAENRSMNESESGQFEAATKEFKALSERAATIQGLVDNERKLDGLRSGSPIAASGGDYRDPMDGQIREFLSGERRSIDLSFKGLNVVRNAQGVNEVRSLLTSTPTAPVPTSFRTVLYQHLVQNSVIRQYATVLTSSSGENIILPKTTAHPANGTIVAEGALINESDPTFGQGTLTSYKYPNIIQVSTENLEDTGVDLEGYLAKAMGRALGNGSGAHLVTGTGSGQPQGVLVGSGTIAQVVGGTPAANGATYAELVSVFDKIIPAYQVNATWFMSQSALSKVRALVNTQGTPLFTESLAVAPGNELFGRPIAVDPAMPAVGVGGTSIAFGDFSTYFVRDVALRFERSVDYAFGNDLVTYRAVLRSDGRLLDLTGSIANYKGGTS